MNDLGTIGYLKKNQTGSICDTYKSNSRESKNLSIKSL